MTSDNRPWPVADATTEAFWSGLQLGDLLVQVCEDCRRHVFYPRPVCPFCTGSNLEWIKTAGRAHIYSYTIVHRPPPGFPKEPYVVALVDLVEGVRMMTQIANAGIDEVVIGMEVQLTPDPTSGLPYFSPI